MFQDNFKRILDHQIIKPLLFPKSETQSINGSIFPYMKKIQSSAI